MFKRWSGWVLLAVVTFLNLRLFLSRWSEEPRAPFSSIGSDVELASITIGAGILVIALSFLETVWSRRWIAALCIAGVSSALVWWLYGIPAFTRFLHPTTKLVLAGAFAALLCFKLRDSEEATSEQHFMCSFVLLTFASLNFFLLTAPWSTQVPSYIQDTITEIPRLRGFYYGSIHSDLSPVSVFVRAAINLFFPFPSINATTLSSMLYVSLGLAMAAIAVQMVFGQLWGWMLLIVSWSDRWIFASAISSAIIGQPVLSTASVLLLCTWTLWRKPGVLSWRESAALGAINAVGLVYNLYGYSAARMPWLVGSGIAALILIARRTVWFNADGLKKVAATLLPSVLIVFIIWLAIFGGDTQRFSSQLFISPKLENRIKDLNDYRVTVISAHDPDMPIWWGTGHPADGENVSLYWRRTPQELLEKVQWFMKQVASDPPVPFLLLLIGSLGIIVGLTSPLRLRRSFTAVVAVLAFVSFSTFVLAQDASAYRRGLATNLLILVGVVMLFAVKARGGVFKSLAVILCTIFALLKAPTELNALFNESFWSPVCVNCQPHINVRELVNDAAYQAVADRQLRIVVRGKSLPPSYSKCALMTIGSYEFKKQAPNSRELLLGEKSISQAFSELQSGDILLTTCLPQFPNDPEMAAVCSDTPPFGKFLGTIPADHAGRSKAWWALIEKP